MAKTTEDFLSAGIKEAVSILFEQMNKWFSVGKAIVKDRMNFNGCVIEIGPDKGVTLGMHAYRDRLAPIEMSRNRSKDINSRASEREIAEYWSLAGTLLYLGTAVLPQAALVTSVMQQRINQLKVIHVLYAK